MNEEYTYAADSDMRPFGRPGFGFGRPGFGFGRPGFGFGFGRPGFGFGRPWFGYGFGRPFGFYGGPFFGGLVGGLSEALYSIRTCTEVTATLTIRITTKTIKKGSFQGPFYIGLMS
ncbi:hypothetical protein JS608_02184 [Bacillus amyloliquefaciens]|nr:hypothetical protein JS608_02184 [Bacillus amyloliquefaciens]